jgi:hypothetical protein
MIAGTNIKPLVALGRDGNDCWQWLGGVNSLGYPSKTIGGKTTTGQRWMWQQLHGPLPDTLKIRLTCGNRLCINPHHFEVTTMTDAQRAGANAVLTPADVQEIRRHRKSRGPGIAEALARRCGCSVMTVRDIWRGDTWRRPRLPADLTQYIS